MKNNTTTTQTKDFMNSTKYLAEVSDTKVLRRGAPKKYDGKFTIFDLSRFEKKKSIIKD